MCVCVRMCVHAHVCACLYMVCSGSVVRSSDSQSRGPEFESTCCHFIVWGILFIPHCLSSLSLRKTVVDTCERTVFVQQVQAECFPVKLSWCWNDEVCERVKCEVLERGYYTRRWMGMAARVLDRQLSGPRFKLDRQPREPGFKSNCCYCGPSAKRTRVQVQLLLLWTINQEDQGSSPTAATVLWTIS